MDQEDQVCLRVAHQMDQAGMGTLTELAGLIGEPPLLRNGMLFSSVQ